MDTRIFQSLMGDEVGGIGRVASVDVGYILSRGARVAGVLPRFLEICAVLALGLVGARLFWLIVDASGAVSQAGPSRSIISQTSARPVVAANLGVLTQLDPFSSDAPIEIVEDPAEIEAPETSLNLVLSGVRAATDEQQGTAYILTPDKRQAAYRVGDEVLPGVTVSRILAGRVVIDRRGELESLTMSPDGALNVLGADRPNPTEPSEQSERESASDQRSAASGRGRVSPDALLREARFVPIREGGRVQRYRIVSASGSGVLADAGLEPDDEIVSVDGQDIATIDPETLFERLEGGGTLRLTLLRDGNRLSHTIDLTREER